MNHRHVLLLLAAPLSASADAPWHTATVEDGIKIEAREVAGSSFDELRLSTDSASGLDALCDAVWAKDVGNKAEGDFKKRVVIREDDHERWTYEQIRAPLVSDRDYVMKVTLLQPASSGRCEIAFETAKDPSYPPTSDHVRLTNVRGHWLLTPTASGKVNITYQLFSEPGGSVPAFLAKGGQRSAAVDFFKTILSRAQKAKK
ncbi:MAG: START domain-containing protein [Myxococcaceae bacterium]